MLRTCIIKRNDVASLIKNWEQVEKATQAAYESEGTTREEQGKYIESLQGYLDKLTTSWQALSKDFLNSSFLKTGVTALTTILDLFDGLVKKVGALGTIGLANGALQLFKNGGYFKDLASSLKDSTLSMSNFGTAASMAASDLKSFIATPTGILTSIGLITAAVGVGIQIYNSYRQKISEERQKDIEEAKNAVEEANNVTDLYGKYQEANVAYESNMGSKEALTEATNNLLSALGIEESQIDSLVEKYGSLDEAINQVTAQTLSDAVDKAIQGFNSAYDTVEDAFGNGGDWGANIAKWFGVGKESLNWYEETKDLGNKIGKILEDAQLLSSGSYNQGGQLFLQTDNTDQIIESYEKLLNIQKTLKDALKNGELTQDEYNNSSLVDAVDSEIFSFETVLKDYIEAKDNLNNATANSIVFDELTNNGIPKTIEEVKSLKNELIETAETSDKFQGTAQDIETAFDNAFENMSKQFPELNKIMNDDGIEATKAASKEQLESFSKQLGASWENLSEDIKIAYNDYQQVLEEIKSKGIDPNDVIFGNIDLDDRGVIEWTEKNIQKYKDVLTEYAKDDYINNLYKQQGEEALQSFFDSGKEIPQSYIDDYINSFRDSISTVFGGSKPFDIQGEEIEIAFSPMLQTDDGAELLSPSTVDSYIKKIIESATSDGDWSFNEILSLDAEGLEIDGKQISGLIADIGDTAIKTGESMHYLGKDGVAGIALQEFQDKLKSVGLTEEEFYNAISNNDVKKWFDSLNEDDKNLVYELSVKSDDTTLWSLTKWKEELEAIKETGQSTSEQMEQFYDIMNDPSDDSLSKNIENYTKNLETLQDALSKINTGEFTKSDMVSLSTEFPSLIPYTNDLDSLSDAIQNLINTSNQDMNDTIDSFIEELGDDAPEAIEALEALRNAINGLTQTDTGFSFDIDEEITKFDNLYAAMKESVSGTGLTKNAINNVKSMFKDLDGYDASKLFERTANGIHLNTNELRKLQAQYKENKTKELNDELQKSVDKYNELGKSLSDVNSSAKDRSATLKEMSNLKEHISEVADLASQYEGLTSAYNRWTLAQSSGEEGDMYDSIRDNLEEVNKMYEDGLIGTNAFRSYVDLLSGQDLSTANAEQVQVAWQKLGQVIEGTSYKATDFLAEGSDGVLNFLKATEQLNSEWAHMNSDGSWDINFGVGNDREIADRLGVDVEFIQSMMRKLSDYGFDVNLDSVYTKFDKLSEYAEQANEKLKELGQTNIDFDFNTSDIEILDQQIIEAQSLLDKFKNTDGTVNTTLEGADEAETVLVSLITHKQELNKPAIMTVDTANADANISSTIGLLQDFQTNYNDIEIETAVGADTSQAQTNIQNVITQIQGLPTDIQAKLGFDDDEFQQTLSSIASTDIDVKAGVSLNTDDINAVQERISGITPEMIANLSVNSKEADEYEAPDKDATVTYDINDVKVQKYTAPSKTGTVTYTAQMNSWTPPVKYGSVVYTVKGNGRVDGTAHVNGTAFAKGDWGTKKSETALTGELGRELIVYGGKYWTVGDNGAEFANIPKGAIVFNHKQTEELLENGKITNGKKRGQVFVNGSAFVEGTAFSNGSGTFYHGGQVVTTTSGTTTKKPSNNNTKTNTTSKSSSETKKDPEYFDWIELKIDRIERAIESLNKKATSVYKTWGTRNQALSEQISKVGDEINIQAAAYQRYMEQANSVGLSADLAEKVKNGAIDITQYDSESETYKKIELYQQWLEKALDCKDTIEDLKEKEAELYKQRFDNITTKYDSILETFDYKKSMLDEKISQQETQGHIVSNQYYSALIKQEQNNIDKLNEKRSELISARDEAINSGKIEYGSEAWREMSNQIDQVTLSIEQANSAVLEYNKSIRETNWKVFDLIEDRISEITNESDFLIKLMQNEKLYEDNGQLTNQGKATMGLHAVNYDTYMEKADKYAEEIKKINKDIAKDPYNQDLIERKQELIELQQESILAANEEKEAIKDMVSEGIKKELDALQKLIDKYKDSLSSQKNLYDYQNKVKDQTSSIASLEKQLSAYQGDTSEETKAKIQQLKVSLEDAKQDLKETEYEQFISDTEKMLDDLYDNYELIINTRLDNLDKLLSDMIASTNQNATLIKTTLESETSKVGISLSDKMDAIWDTNGKASNVVATYGSGISGTLTTIGSVISTISVNIQNMMNDLNNKAKEDVKIPTVTTTTQKPSTTTTTSKPTTTTSKPTTTTSKPNNSKNVSDDTLMGVASAIWVYNGDGSGWGNDPTRNKRLTEKFGSANASKVQSYINAYGRNGVLYNYYVQHGKNLNKYKYNAFKTGKKDIDTSQLAWTQEEGKEFIVRPSDGAILTPVAQNDSILTSNASKNIWDMANNPNDFIRNNLNFGKTENTSIAKNADNNTLNANVSLNLTLPNVKNYEEFKYAMQHDKNFENMIKAMTVDKVFGGSSLKKYKY